MAACVPYQGDLKTVNDIFPSFCLRSCSYNGADTHLLWTPTYTDIRNSDDHLIEAINLCYSLIMEKFDCFS